MTAMLARVQPVQVVGGCKDNHVHNGTIPSIKDAVSTREECSFVEIKCVVAPFEGTSLFVDGLKSTDSYVIGECQIEGHNEPCELEVLRGILCQCESSWKKGNISSEA